MAKRALNFRAWVTARLVSSVAADPGREAEVVLDPPRRAGLTAESGALDHQRVEAFGSAVDGGAQAGRAGADDEQVDLLPRRELAADPERARDLTGAMGPGSSAPPGKPDQRQARLIEAFDQRRGRGRSSIARGHASERQAVAAGELEHLHRGLRRVRPDDLEPEALDRWSASRRAMKAESTTSLSGPSSYSSDRSVPRSTAM